MKPESSETLDTEFSTAGLDAKQIAAKIDEHKAMLQREAGDLVREWFMRHGYFNGRAESTLFSDNESDCIRIQMVVTCWGLPRMLIPVERAVYPFAGTMPPEKALRLLRIERDKIERAIKIAQFAQYQKDCKTCGGFGMITADPQCGEQSVCPIEQEPCPDCDQRAKELGL